jgi:NADPH-dependent 2,4-dienoyl-CoA reductase/sulfur reductase-like enzyme/rhodanese-related sulfurtransferase
VQDGSVPRMWQDDVGRVRSARRLGDAQRAARRAVHLLGHGGSSADRHRSRDGQGHGTWLDLGLVRTAVVTTPRGPGLRVVIVGGVAGGMSAATRLRRDDEQAQITVLERGEHVSFANCGLPYRVGGVIEEREDLLLQTPESLARRFRIDVRVRQEAMAIDLAQRLVTVWERDTGTTYQLPYDALVLATGASPVLPPIPGIERAHVLRDVPDSDRLVAAVQGADDRPAQTAVVIGGGFIGLELAENLVRRGLDVTVVELADQVLAPLDAEMAQPVADELERAGVHLRTGVATSRVAADHVVLDDGTVLPADLVVAAIGVRPESRLASDAGLAVGERGGIVVDDQQRTSDPHVFAVGDAAEKLDAVSDAPTLVPLAQTANRHGRLAADVITGREVCVRPVLGTAVVGVLGLTVAVTGWNEKRLRAAGRPHRVIHTHPASHAGYYPGAETMSLKLLVDPATDEILGAQAVGGQGVDKRIDVIATAMRGRLTASDLADLELAYAPQYGSAKDPVNMLGMVADNLAAGAESTVQWHQLAERRSKGAVLLDVRGADEVLEGAIPGSLNLPLDALRDRMAELPDAPLVVYCAVGARGHTAARLLRQHGFDVANLDGGYRTWSCSPAARDAHAANAQELPSA